MIRSIICLLALAVALIAQNVPTTQNIGPTHTGFDVFAGGAAWPSVIIDPTTGAGCTNATAPPGITWNPSVPMSIVVGEASLTIWTCKPDSPSATTGTWRQLAGGGAGTAGPPGTAATISVGVVSTLPPGSPATVSNAGNNNAAVFDFGIPQGIQGPKGDVGNGNEIIKFALCQQANCVALDTTGSNSSSVPTTISGCLAHADTAPVGHDLTIDVQNGGSSIFSGGVLLTITAGTNDSIGTDTVVGHPITALAATAIIDPTTVLKPVIQAIGTTTAGAGVRVTCYTLPNNVILAADQTLIGNASGAAVGTAMPNCPDSGTHLNYSTSTHTYSCGGSLGSTGVLAEANGGTGSAVTTGPAGHIMRSNGTHYVDSAIQTGDVPTLNQNTSGTAANLSGTPTLPAGTNLSVAVNIPEIHKFIFCSPGPCNGDSITLNELVVYASHLNKAYFSIGTAPTSSLTVQCTLSGAVGSLFTTPPNLNGQSNNTVYDVTSSLNAGALAALSTIKSCAVTGTAGNNIEMVVVTR